MKLILAALAAGLLGGGAVVGAVASGVLPMDNLVPRESRVKPGASGGTDIAALEDEVATLRNEKDRLAKDNSDLKSTIKQVQNDYDALNKKLDGKASKADLDKVVAAKTSAPSNTAPNPDGTTPAPVTAAPNSPEYHAAWRAEQEAYDKERQEQRKLNQQADRIKQLEEAKKLAADTIPKTISGQAQRLNLNETQVKAASDTLVAHAQKRLELLSSMQEKRINDEDVDQEAFQTQLADLDAATKATLMGSVDEKTADALLQMTNRSGRNTTRRGGGGGGNPGRAGGNGGNGN